MSKMVWVEVNDAGLPVRIFRNRKAAYAFGKEWVGAMLRVEAVGSIRHQIFLRSKGECEICATPLNESSGHLHEQKHRGQGGEISLENSIFICPTCHRHAHADRNPHFTKKP